MFTAREVLAIVFMAMLAFYGAIIATRGIDTFGGGYLWLWASGLIVGQLVGYMCNNWERRND
mgnify:CR=1 FL=1